MRLGWEAPTKERIRSFGLSADKEYLLKDSIFLGTHANPMARAMWVAWFDMTGVTLG